MPTATEGHKGTNVNKQQFIMEVAQRLGIEGRPPHHVTRQIESCLLQEMSVDAAAAAITEANVRSTG